ncbi:hypothetical protein CXB51_023934 [Gossypium anomalum]|uniref:DUF7745 domain-containing protein n=1 Tax=Gossypium anomalum TaxID=47600 RepID=A0A8J5YT63_9ROSI|nr:hypothetical protein CXB51_023934 [Gossypium anomalum]
MTDAWAEKQIKKKNETVCIPWSSLRESVLSHPDILKRVNLFALAIYGLVIFPRVLGHIEVAVFDFFERLKQGVNPVPTILAETFRSLIILESRAHSIPHVFKNIRPARSLPQERMAEEVTEQHWSCYTNVETKIGYLTRIMGRNWICPTVSPKAIFFATIYTRNRRASAVRVRFHGEGYMKKVRDTAKSWNEIHFMELALYADTLTQDYDIWRKQRVSSQQISSTNCTAQNPFLEEMPSELDIARQEFEREKAKMSRDLSTLQEENYQLKIEAQVERSRTEKYKGRPRS